MAKLDPMTVVIEVLGGVVQAVFSDQTIPIISIDWDNIYAGGDAVGFGYQPLASMSKEAAHHTFIALNPAEEP